MDGFISGAIGSFMFDALFRSLDLTGLFFLMNDDQFKTQNRLPYFIGATVVIALAFVIRYALADGLSMFTAIPMALQFVMFLLTTVLLAIDEDPRVKTTTAIRVMSYAKIAFFVWMVILIAGNEILNLIALLMEGAGIETENTAFEVSDRNASDGALKEFAQRIAGIESSPV